MLLSRGLLGLTQAEHLTMEGLLSPTPSSCIHDTDHVQVTTEVLKTADSDRS